jgi:hypothetical protein
VNDRMVTVPWRVAGTLADTVLALGPGSSCFCCGSLLQETEAAVPALSVSLRGRLLRCPSCGAEISTEEPTDAPPAALRNTMVRRQVLAAA